MLDKLLQDIRIHGITLTGSRALQAYGMLRHREVNDIDLVFVSLEQLRGFCLKTGYTIKEEVDKPPSRKYDENYFKLYLGDIPIADCFIKEHTRSENGCEYFRDIWAAKLRIILDRLPNTNDPVYNKHLADFDSFFHK